MEQFGAICMAIVVLMAHRADCTSNFTCGCSSLCSIAFDEDLSCWNKTIAFFTDVVVSSMKHYVTTQASIMKWNKYHGQEPISKELIMKDSVDRMNSLPTSNIDDDRDILDESVVLRVVEGLVASAEVMATDKEPLPAVECPFGCEYHWNLWMWLTIASLCISGAIVSVMLVSAIRMDTIDKNDDEFEQIDDVLDGRCGKILNFFGF